MDNKSLTLMTYDHSTSNYSFLNINQHLNLNISPNNYLKKYKNNSIFIFLYFSVILFLQKFERKIFLIKIFINITLQKRFIFILIKWILSLLYLIIILN